MAHIVNPETCIGCTACVAACPMSTIEMKEEKAFVNPESCIDCDACSTVCPSGSIYLDEGAVEATGNEEILELKEPEVVEAKPAVELLHFYADWCGPCKQLEPILNEFYEKHKDELAVKHINVDENEAEALNYKVMSIPTLIFEVNGEIEKIITGFQNLEALEDAYSKISKE